VKRCALAILVGVKGGEVGVLGRIDDELTAIRPAAAVRASSMGIGKRLLSLYASIRGDENFSVYARMLPHGNAAAAYAVVSFHCGLAEREALLVFGYNRLAGIVSAGLRLISIGQQQGQTLLTIAIDHLPHAADRIIQRADEPLRSFSPVLDIQQMNHQYVYSRLFRSYPVLTMRRPVKIGAGGPGGPGQTPCFHCLC